MDAHRQLFRGSQQYRQHSARVASAHPIRSSVDAQKSSRSVPFCSHLAYSAAASAASDSAVRLSPSTERVASAKTTSTADRYSDWPRPASTAGIIVDVAIEGVGEVLRRATNCVRTAGPRWKRPSASVHSASRDTRTSRPAKSTAARVEWLTRCEASTGPARNHDGRTQTRSPAQPLSTALLRASSPPLPDAEVRGTAVLAPFPRATTLACPGAKHSMITMPPGRNISMAAR